jgi:CheY-like chemotaxis protein
MATLGNMARRILVVDDEEMVGDTIRMVLSLDHHEVETVTASRDALSVFEPGKFDLIITDYEMPVMKGDKLAAAMKALAPPQPILMITAYGQHLRQSRDLPLVVDLVMSKPFDVQKLRDAVRQLTAKA